MAAGPALLDINTGLPVSSSSSQYRNPASEQTNTQTGGRTDTQSQTTNQQTNQSQITQQNILNTTPGALKALEDLIRQLSDRPAISEEELNAKAPNATPIYSRAGWHYTDPLTGRPVYPNQVAQFNRERAAERQKLKEQSGIIKGGTESQKQTEQQRQTEIGRTRTQQGAYSKEAAFGDAQFLIDKALADAMRQLSPGIVAASEGAGTSKSTYRAEALQEVGARGAIEGSALGAQLSVQYGQIYNQLENMLVEMTKQDPNSSAALLLQALQASKGMIQSGTTSSSSSGSQTGTTQVQTQVGPSSQQANTVRNYDVGGLGMGGIPLSLSEPIGMRVNPIQNADPGLNPARPGGADSITIETTPVSDELSGGLRISRDPNSTFDADKEYRRIIGE